MGLEHQKVVVTPWRVKKYMLIVVQLVMVRSRRGRALARAHALAPALAWRARATWLLTKGRGVRVHVAVDQVVLAVVISYNS